MSRKKADELKNDIHLHLLQNLLALEDNKYCADCDAKSPRWASWNIGVFLCIRCAGIHRKLGVHISRVKSVNLDSWTPEQLAYMSEMGNSRGRAIYEAQIPDGFQRPQIDTAIEQLIKAKYELKRYIAHEYIPTKPDVEAIVREIQSIEQQIKKRPGTSVYLPVNKNVVKSPSNVVQRPSNNTPQVVKPAPSTTSTIHNDLIGLFDQSTAQPNNNDLLVSVFQDNSVVPNTNPEKSANLFELDSNQTNPFLESEQQRPAKSTKDSIMSLYDQPPSAQFAAFTQQNLYPSNPGSFIPQTNQSVPSMPMQNQFFTPSTNNADLDGLFATPVMSSQGFAPPAQNVSVFQQSKPTIPQQSSIPADFLSDLNLFGKGSAPSMAPKQTISSNPAPTSANGNFANFSPPNNGAFMSFNHAPTNPAPIGLGDDYLASIQSQLSSLNVKQGTINSN